MVAEVVLLAAWETGTVTLRALSPATSAWSSPVRATVSGRVSEKEKPVNTGAAAAGLDVGAYLYSYIDSEAHARIAAARTLEPMVWSGLLVMLLTGGAEAVPVSWDVPIFRP